MKVLSSNIVSIDKEDWLRIGFASGWIKTAGIKEVKEIMRQRRQKALELMANGHLKEAFDIVSLMKKHIFQIPFTAYSSENEKREFLQEVYGMVIGLDKQIEKARLEQEGKVPAYDGNKNQWVPKDDLDGLPTWKMPRQN